MATTTSLLGLKKPAYTDAADIAVLNGNMDAIDAAIGERTYPHNLLVNSFFNSDAVVDPRGVGAGVWTPAAYNITMWYQTQYGSVSLLQDGLKLDATAEGTNACQVMQSIKNVPAGVYTFVAKVNGSIVSRVISFDGTASTSLDGTNATYTGGYISMGYSSSKKALQPTFRVNAGNSITVEWAAVYLGDFRKGALPAYVWKGYDTELRDCQRYVQTYDVQLPQLQGSDSLRRYVLMFRDKMRAAPTVTIQSATEYNIATASTGATFAVNLTGADYVRLNASGTVSSTDGLFAAVKLLATAEP